MTETIISGIAALEEMVINKYHVEDINELFSDPYFAPQPMNVPLMLKTFNEDMVVFTEYKGSNRKDYDFNEDGSNWKNIVELVTPNWVHVAITKKTGKPFLTYNWFLFVKNYFKNHPALTFPSYSPGIEYHPKNGAWKLLENDSLQKSFNKNLVDILTGWGINDGQVMNEGLLGTKRLINSQIFNDDVLRPDELLLRSDKQLVAFNNGTYDFDNGQVIQHSKDHYLLNIHDYDVDFHSRSAPETDRMLRAMMGPAADFFKAFIGYCFYPGHDKFQDFIFLKGQGGEGKSTFLRYVEDELIGPGNFSAISPHAMSDSKDKFATSGLYGKEANIVPDISPEPLRSIDTIKGLLGADHIKVEFKFKDGFTMVSRAKNIWSANKLPSISSNDVNRAIADRANVIELINGDTREASNHFWENHNMTKAKQERPQFVGECLYLFQQVLKRYNSGQGKESWNKPDSVEKATQEWLTNSDPIQQWLDSVKEECPHLFEGGYFIKKQAYEDYRNWCEDEGRKPMKKKKLENGLVERFGFTAKRETTPDGSRPYCWVNQQLKQQWDNDHVDWSMQTR